MSWFLIGNLTEHWSAISLAVSYWLQNKEQPSHRFTTSEQPQQRNGQRADKAFKDVVITVSNTVTHDSYVLVKGKNHIQGSWIHRLEGLLTWQNLPRYRFLHRSILLAFFPATFHQGHEGCYTGNTCAHECDSSDKLKIKNNTHTK